MPVEVECLNCGAGLQRYPSRAEGRNFCDQDCKGEHDRAERIKLKCFQCREWVRIPVPEARRREKVFCSKGCVWAWMSEDGAGKVEVECLNCGAAMERWPSEAGGKNFCDQDCQGEYNRVQRIDLECCRCQERVRIPVSEAGEKDKVFCSRDCSIAWQSESNTGKDNPQYDREEYECQECGERFERAAWHAERNDRNFCSKGCEESWKSAELFHSGEESPAWSGGHPRWYGSDWKGQRRAAIERDGGKCQSCGMAASEMDRSLHVHHIIPFREFEDRSEANKLQNLVTLCLDCHWEWEGEHARPILLGAGDSGVDSRD